MARTAPWFSFTGIAPRTVATPRSLGVCAALLLAAPSIAAAQKTGTFCGTISDSRTHEALAGVQVTVGHAGPADTTDSLGSFCIDSIPIGLHDIHVGADGYYGRVLPSRQVTVGRNRDIELALDPKEHVQDLDGMVVRAERLSPRSSLQSTSVLRLSRDEILTAPGAGQDIAQVLQSMPSVAGAAHEGFTRLLVRGGDEDENALLVDGIEVNTLTHWGNPYEPGGGVSLLHPDYIRSVDFYAGGVPVLYPPRLSAVTDISFRDGSMTDRTWQVDLNTGGFGFFFEGPIVEERASYIVNARVGVTYLLSFLAGLDGVPEYQNGQAKCVWKVSDRDKLSLNLLAGHETITFEPQDYGGDYHHNDGAHVAGGLQWRRTMDWGANDLLVSGIYHDINWTNLTQNRYRDADWYIRRSTLQLKDDLRVFVRDRDLLSIGVVAEREDCDEAIRIDEYSVWADTLDSTYSYFGDTADAAGLPLALVKHQPPANIAYDTAGYRIGAYLSYAWHAGPLRITMGMRDDYFTLWRQHGLSPRGAVGVEIGAAGFLSLSAGSYRQAPAKFDWQTDSLELWDIELQRARQIALGYEGQLGDAIVYGAEAYYKYYDREPLHAVRQTGAGVGYRDITLSTDHYSHKRAYGLELYLQKKKLDAFYYQIAYALTRAEQEYEGGEWYEDDNNLRNSASVILGSNFHRSHRVSLRFDISEGSPYTPLAMDASREHGTTLYDIADGWNGERRPWRLKLNLRYDMTLNFKRTTVTLYLEGYNLLNQRDIVHEYFTYGDSWPDGERVEVLSRSILPGLGLYITF